MSLFITTFESVAVLLGIGLIGFYIIKKGILPGNILTILSPLALEIALPSLIFARILTTFTPDDFPDWWQLPLWWSFFTIISFGLTSIFMFTSEKTIRREFAISLFYQNAIFFPLAIFSGMFTGETLDKYLIYLFFSLYVILPCFLAHTFSFSKQKKKLKSILEESSTLC